MSTVFEDDFIRVSGQVDRYMGFETKLDVTAENIYAEDVVARINSTLELCAKVPETPANKKMSLADMSTAYKNYRMARKFISICHTYTKTLQRRGHVHSN